MTNMRYGCIGDKWIRIRTYMALEWKELGKIKSLSKYFLGVSQSQRSHGYRIWELIWEANRSERSCPFKKKLYQITFGLSPYNKTFHFFECSLEIQSCVIFYHVFILLSGRSWYLKLQHSGSLFSLYLSFKISYLDNLFFGKRINTEKVG